MSDGPRELMTLDAFRAWLLRTRPRIYVRHYRVKACECGDLNCHGWRLVTWG